LIHQVSFAKLLAGIGMGKGHFAKIRFAQTPRLKARVVLTVAALCF